MVSFVQTSSISKVTVLVLALAGNVLGVTQTFYNTAFCGAASKTISCTNLPANRCCRSSNGSAYVAAQASNIDKNDASAISTNKNGDCVLHSYTTGTSCIIAGGDPIVYGAWWYPLSSSKRDSDATITSQCKGSQLSDVYHFALPGEEQKPYDTRVADLFGAAGVIEWSTHTFKADKLDLVREIIVQHGDGLNEVQKTALLNV